MGFVMQKKVKEEAIVHMGDDFYDLSLENGRLMKTVKVLSVYDGKDMKKARNSKSIFQ